MIAASVAAIAGIQEVRIWVMSTTHSPQGAVAVHRLCTESFGFTLAKSDYVGNTRSLRLILRISRPVRPNHEREILFTLSVSIPKLNGLYAAQYG